MWKKNFGGKVLSPPPTDSDDINEEIIINDDISDDDKSEKKVKKSKKKKRSKRKKRGPLYKFCKTCGDDILENERRNGFMYKDTYHQLQARDYCDDHERVYSEHKCKPIWCGDCGYLSKYEIFVDWDKKAKNW